MGLRFKCVRAGDRIHVGEDIIIEVVSGGNGRNLGVEITAPKEAMIVKEQQLERPLPRAAINTFDSSG